MVKKASTAKTKKVETVEEKIEDLATETPQKSSAPHMMQVVEVMDEEVEDIKSEEKKENPEVEVTHSEMIEPEDTKTELPDFANTDEEKKQAVVSEFFAKKPASLTSQRSGQAGVEPVAPAFGYPDISVHKKSPISGVLAWALGIILLVVAIGAIIIATSRGSVKLPTFGIQPTVTPTAVPLPTAIPTPVVDKTTVKIQVLNGSGTAGEAGKMKTLLEEKGYTVLGTGNAKSYDYAQTEIQVTADNEPFLAVLTSDLSGSYVVGSTAATLKSALPYNIVVIVGKE